jgi:pimeloyl-ACP methyl ester carboxylesterase
LGNGRAVGYSEWGDPDGAPVLGFLGTSLSWLAHLGHDAPRSAGVRLVLVDRPGYGMSDLHPGRTLLDWPRDVEELADALGIGRFAVFGMSGGGPHAAACAYALPRRVTALGLVSSAGPVWDRPELIYSAPPHRRPLIELARRDRTAVASRLLEDCRDELARIGENSNENGSGPTADREVLADPDVRARFDAASRETALRGPEGYAHDLYLLYVEPWGFRPEDIGVPTQVWHGDEDTAVPLGVAEFFAAAVPGAALHVVPGAGHLVLWSHAQEILEGLR